MKIFTELTKEDVEVLRKKPISVASKEKGVKYNFTQKEVDDAREHLETIYEGKVRISFASKIILLNEIY